MRRTTDDEADDGRQQPPPRPAAEASAAAAGQRERVADDHRTQQLTNPAASNRDLERVQDEIRALSPGLSSVIHEDDDNVIIRRPITYGSINTSENDSVVASRYRYYHRLDPQSQSAFIMPAHVVPSECYLQVPTSVRLNTQSSIITIFSIWNTMLGTSILSMPWALEKAGFGFGILLMILMAGITLYTAYRVIRSKDHIHVQGTDNLEFSDVVRHYLGQWGEYISVIFSVLSLVGATVVYWILMSNFLYNTVLFIYLKVRNEFNSTDSVGINGSSYPDVLCPHPGIPKNELHQTDGSFNSREDRDLISMLQSSMDAILGSNSRGTFDKVWSQTITVPFFLIVVLAPLINFKSPTFFTKFNSLGTVSVLYILTFILVKGIKWGIHMDAALKIPEFQKTFPALTGILALAYFIHNCIVSIMRNQRHPENNGRDLSIAYGLVTVTYVFVGMFFYICFPLPKHCIEDNLLNNFVNSDIMAFVARIFLFFQMVTVFPLLLFILRIQVLNLFFHSVYPSLKHVLVLNAIIIIVCLVFATQMPQIGTIIRFSGALCGFVYIFTLPCVVYLLALRRHSSLTWPIVTIHVVVIILGLLNFVAQFLILGQT